MSSTIRIALSSGHKRKVTAQFDDVAGRDLAVVLPGLRYGCERPLLRDVAEVFRDRGCDIARFKFRYSEEPDFLNADDEAQLAQIACDGRDIISGLMDPERYQRIWIVGKSLGTISMGAALSEPIFPHDCVRAVWLTPSLVGTPLLTQILAQSHKSIVVIGTDDPSFRSEFIAPLEATTNVAIHSVQGANHEFEHEDGANASDVAVSEAVQVISDWVESDRAN